MDALEKNERLNQLYQLYKDLLTDKQQSYFEAYYVNDYSFAEIASYYDVSRNAVFDQLKKTNEHLDDYESKLKLFERRSIRQSLLDTYIKTKDESILLKLKEMDDQ
jgi:predicted DNA-binding protein YlxM (UPF0122 family)